MAFTKTVINRRMVAGDIEETGTWALTAGSTTGVITPAFSGQGISAGIIEILMYGAGSDTNSAALVWNLSSDRKTLQITSAANDTGEYFIRGRVA